MSTLAYACDDDVQATFANKTAVENECLVSYSSNVETSTLIEFTSLTTLDGVDPVDLQADATAQQAAIVTMSQTMSGVTSNQVSIESITASGRRLALAPLIVRSIRVGSISTTAGGSNVNYVISAYLEQLGYSPSQVESAYASLTSQITSSIQTGLFTQNLKANGQTLGLTTFQSASVTAIPSYSEPTVTILATASPTSLPTFSPTEEKRSRGDDDALSDGVIAATVLMTLFGVGMIAVFIYCIVQRKGLNEEDYNSKLAKNTPPSDNPLPTQPAKNAKGQPKGDARLKDDFL
jgi:hypothetical protein